MKLHYSALCKDMFLYMAIFFKKLLFWSKKDSCCSGGGEGGGVVTAQFIQRGIRDRGFVPFLVVLTGKVRSY